MAQILLLKPNDIPRLTSLSGNIDVDKITPHIFTAQTTDIRRILGTTLYDKIVADYDADTLSGIYATIYNDYVLFILSNYSAAYYVKVGGYQVSNAGIVKMSVENGTAVEMKDTNAISEHYSQIAISFESQLLTYLDSVTIPEYPKAGVRDTKRIIKWY